VTVWVTRWVSCCALLKLHTGWRLMGPTYVMHTVWGAFLGSKWGAQGAGLPDKGLQTKTKR
jgi:hypothetical protein